MELTTKSPTTIQCNIKDFDTVKKQRHTTAYDVSGHAYIGDTHDQTAIQHYEKALKIAREEGHKLWETIAHNELTHACTSNNQNETEIQQYMQFKRKEGYKLLETVAYFPATTSCLFFTSVCSKDCDYEKAKKLYEKVLNFLGTEPNHHLLRDKTLAGFGVVLFNLEDTEKTVKSIYQIETSIANTDTKTDPCENNYGSTANVSDTAQLQDTQHETADNVDLIHFKSKCFCHDRIVCKEQAPIVDETRLKDSKAKAYQHLRSTATENTHKKTSKRDLKKHKIPLDLEADEIEVIEYWWSDYNQLQAGQFRESIKCYSHGVKFAITPDDFESTSEKRLEREVYTSLGHAYYKSFMFCAALESYRKAEEILKDIGKSQKNINICFMLGHTFRQLKQNELAIQHYQKALSIHEILKDEGMQRNRRINESREYCSSFNDDEKANEIAKQGQKGYQEYCINQAIGNTFWNTGSFEKAKNYYQEALDNAKKLDDKGCEGTSYLGLASVASKEFDYEMARKWYKKAKKIFEIEHIDTIMNEKALVGLGITSFNLGNIQEAIEYIEKARKLAAKESENDNAAVGRANQQKNPTKKVSSTQTLDGINVENIHQILDHAKQTASPSSIRTASSNLALFMTNE